ncbi:MAG: hypothetical protein H7210_13395 [Pyrinomonadaceae bacterium]|nr:hypothetical protein [Phycisphaerales bacterium]
MLTVLASNPILPPWVVLPMAVVTMLVISWHVLAIQRATMPASRKRIRTANGLLMLLVTALLAYALSIMNAAVPRGAAVDDVRLFVLVWALIMGLLPMVIGLAMLDALNNIRLHRVTRRKLKQQLGSHLLNEVMERARARQSERNRNRSDHGERESSGDARNAG